VATQGGYWIVDQTGHVEPLGGATDHGSATFAAGDLTAGMASDPSGSGYWVVSASGNVEAFGSAKSFGRVTTPLNAPIVGMTPTADGQGYYLLGRDGGIFAFGDATFFGSTGGLALNSPVLGIGAANRPASGAVIDLTNENNGGTITVRSSDQVIATLGAIVSESWNLATPPNEAVLHFVGRKENTFPTAHLNYRTDVFTFAATGLGHTSAVMTSPPGPSDNPASNLSFSFSVNVVA
ncbi:MAG: hypothetical protein ACYDD7_25090, partial [Acidimicrobiales bacterium]